MTLRSRVVAAAVNLGLTVYAGLTVACVKLLHCVHIPGTPASTRHLFLQVWCTGLRVCHALVRLCPCASVWRCACAHLVAFVRLRACLGVLGP